MRALFPPLKRGLVAEGVIPGAWGALERACFSTEAADRRGTSALTPWLPKTWISAAVSFVDGQEPPTALTWLRRRGPGIPESYLQRLFRERQIRVFNGTQVRVVRKSVVMEKGFKLLVMKERLQEFNNEPSNESKPKEEKQQVAKKKKTDGPGQWTWESLWKRKLYQDSDMIVINKPEGLATQNGTGVKVSVDSILRQRALEHGWEPPKLVHRLDKDTSGVLVIAKNTDAASWMAEAFRERSSDDGKSKTVFRVRKTYWAITQAGPALQSRGTVKKDIVANGNRLPAETVYFCKEISHGLALLKLMPVTGRKHQLRIHCACVLGAPILGDDSYRKRKEELEIPAIPDLKKAGALGKMHLHAGTLVIGKPGKKPIKIVAPPPRHMVEACKVLGWTCNMN
ncbi:hypothetical protein BSKO_04261 [Bryopsis sp. KO-2023]|nr:hypothetical protein BSKO_04261 [Bryopsis sp. KO-2023]